jgi:hypothetical protein
MFTGRKLPLTLAFTVLVALAFGVSCRGFFVKPTLTALAINPTAPAVNVGQSQTLQVFGTFDDGSRSALTSGVGWSTDTPTVATITGTGSAVLAGVAPGSATITASAQALSATASATVLLTGVTSITVTPTSQSITGLNTQSNPFTFSTTVNGTTIDITTSSGGTLTVSPNDGHVTCAPSGGTEICTPDGSETSGTQYTITMTYNGSNASASATLTFNQ